MTMLVVGDLHYDLRKFDWLLGEAHRHHAVVITGDLLDIASSVPVDAQIPVVLDYLRRLVDRATTIACSGNHDLTGRDTNGEKAPLWLPAARALGVVTDGSDLTYKDALITVCPWWDGPIGKAALDARLAGLAPTAPERWIWVYHWPPPDLPVSSIGERFYGDADLAGWIERFHPALVLSGHVHQSPWVTGGSWIAQLDATTIINCGSERSPVPSHCVIDLESWSATWTSSSGTERRDLSAAAVPVRDSQ